MKLEVYADRMSQPSRAGIIFCKVNGIDYTELKVDISKREHLTPEFAEINPMKQLPAIVDGKFKLFERYPADLFKRSKIHSVLYWHHSNLRRAAAAEAEKLLFSSLSKIESFWLKGDGPFLLGGNQPSIADLSLVCELMQLEVLDEKDRDRFFGPYKKVQQWIKHTRNATSPHFDNVHIILMKVKEKLTNKPLMEANHGGARDIEKRWRSRM
ncbi:glutathione S-transferase T1 isoform X4 [Gossypium hirsutum]|uniref:Glutathione S-transferase T1 isoform X4 n=1 Tax=Gossypium hirsutum TaxID=3635 RepID=A0ABM2YJX6_GOSHI|nr:glutathione S-transferase T1 isoform X4 [Gossypium hirsutum]